MDGLIEKRRQEVYHYPLHVTEQKNFLNFQLITAFEDVLLGTELPLA